MNNDSSNGVTPSLLRDLIVTQGQQTDAESCQ